MIEHLHDIFEPVSIHFGLALELGNRGLGPVSRVFLGSVSQHLVHHSTAPVMIVPFTPAKKA
jgi:hypothetical protein